MADRGYRRERAMKVVRIENSVWAVVEYALGEKPDPRYNGWDGFFTLAEAKNRADYFKRNNHPPHPNPPHSAWFHRYTRADGGFDRDFWILVPAMLTEPAENEWGEVCP